MREDLTNNQPFILENLYYFKHVDFHLTIIAKNMKSDLKIQRKMSSEIASLIS